MTEGVLVEDSLLGSCSKTSAAKGQSSVRNSHSLKSLVLFDQIPHLLCQLLVQRVLLSFVQVGVISLDQPAEIWRGWWADTWLLNG